MKGLVIKESRHCAYLFSEPCRHQQAKPATSNTNSTVVQPQLTCLQDGDPFAQYPDDADVPEGESEVAFRIRAATEIKGIGNELYKKASDGRFCTLVVKKELLLSCLVLS